MSVIRQQATDLTDQQCLTEALKELGYNPVVQDRAAIRGHAKEKSKEGCEVVLRKEDTGRGADVGFSKQENGSYSIITDTWVNKDLANLGEFAGKVKAAYVKQYGRKLARKAGLVYKGEKALTNGKTRMIFATA